MFVHVREQTDRQRATLPKPSQWGPACPDAYAYLLGIYLGDGYLANASNRGARLEVSLDPRYLKIVEECATAIEVVSGTRPTIERRKTAKGTGLRLAATSGIWPSVFPQHGPGRKHERHIELAPWQRSVVNRSVRPFLRGLIHSDGSRCINRFRVRLLSGPREYSYPRYFFTNLSTDIQGLFCSACDSAGVRWTKSSHKNISVSDKTSVALLDSFVGPKE